MRRDLPDETLLITFDDEEAGGTSHWTQTVATGTPFPAAGDWVWGPERCDADGEPVGKRYTRFEVVRRGWNFVSHGSVSAREGWWWPNVRVHVRRLELTEDDVEVELREPGGEWYPFREFVSRFHVSSTVEYRCLVRT